MNPGAFAPVGDDERQRALDVLVTAFTADPVIRWMYPEAHRYLTHFPTFLVAFGGKAFTASTVWRLGEFSAVALWFPPDVEPEGDAVVAVINESVAPDSMRTSSRFSGRWTEPTRDSGIGTFPGSVWTERSKAKASVAS